MLRFILGGAGSGKSARMIEDIARAVAEKRERVYFITPEQFSFESDRLLYDRLGVRGFSAVHAISFTRLAEELFARHGGVAGEYADEAAKLLLMNLAIEQVKDTLALYARQASASAFSRTMLDAVTELKSACVGAQALRDTAESLGGTLGQKARELSMIYEAYHAMLERSYKDTLDDITRAAALAAKYQSFAGATIYIDEFKSFTEGELAFLKILLAQAGEVVISLCTEDANAGGASVFATVNDTYRKLRAMARECECAVALDTVLPAYPRYQSQAIAHISRNLFRPRRERFVGNSDEVLLIEAGDMYQECEYVCAQIRALVISGYRYGDIAVIGRDMDGYTGALESCFARYEIPRFMDGRESVRDKSLMLLVTSAFEAASFHTEAILRYLKTGLCGFTITEISELENFCFTWDVRGRMWLEDFAVEQDGVDQLNGVRRRVIRPLEKFKASTESATGAQITRALFALLEDIGAPEEIARRCRAYAEGGQTQQLHELRQLWDILIASLETMNRVLANTGVTRARYLELLRLILAQSTFSSPPQTLDAVTVGSADRIRIAAPKVVFLIGVNEGVLPYTPKPGGIFTDKERDGLQRAGLMLGGRTVDRLSEERFVAYKAVSMPSQRLYISYALADSAYKEQLQSVIVGQISAMLGRAPVPAKSLDYKLYCTTREAAFYRLASTFRSDTVERASLLQALCSLEGMGGKIDALHQALTPIHHAITDEALSRRLFGERMQISATRFEEYQKCRFLHFCKSGLHLRSLRKMELSPLERGSVIHYCLSEVVQGHPDDFTRLEEGTLTQLAQRALDDYLTESMQGEFAKDGKFMHLYRRLTRVVVEILKRMQLEFAQSDFTPCDFELAIEPGGPVEPMELVTADGIRITVQGVIDRVDMLERDGAKYVRVVDYKSGAKEFRLSDVYYGLNMQMLLYLFAIWRGGRGKYEGVFPAGVLYMPAGEQYGALERAADEEAIEKQRLKSYKMSGIVLDDPMVIEAMEHGVSGVFIPVEQSAKGGYSARSKLIRLEQLGKLHRHAEGLMLEMASTLCGGDIAAVPVLGGGYDPCPYCDYKSVCGHDGKGAVRLVEPMKLDELLARIEEREKGGEPNGQSLD